MMFSAYFVKIKHLKCPRVRNIISPMKDIDNKGINSQKNVVNHAVHGKCHEWWFQVYMLFSQTDQNPLSSLIKKKEKYR